MIEDHSQPKELKKQYNPYMNNNGTVLSIAGKDYVIIAGDKRLSMGFAILSRDSTKIFRLTDKVYIASSGMYADIKALWKNLHFRIEMYKATHKKEPELEVVANLLSITLYMRRFFPYYAFNILAGEKSNGEFTCYGYDAVGSYDQVEYGSQGSGNQLVTPVMDNIINRRKKEGKEIELHEGIDLVKECLNAASNRDIYTGDKMNIVVLHRNGKVEYLEENLRSD
jgi:20S proteasome subunit beta 6